MKDQLSFTGSLNRFIESWLVGIHTAIPARVIAYYSEETRADVQPLISMQDEEGDVQERSIILGVPLQMPGSSTSLVNIPVKQGDIVLCVFSMRGLDAFKGGDGTPAAPTDFRMFDKRDAIAIPGVFPFELHPNQRRVLPFNPDDLSLTHNIGTPGEVTLRLTASGEVKIVAPAGVSVEGGLDVAGNIGGVSSPSSSFATPTGQVVTVVGGTITNVVDSSGADPVNLEYYQNLLDSLETIADCQTLQDKTTTIVEQFNKETEAILDQYEKIEPLLALLDPPTDIGEVISWVTGIIDNVVTPMAAPALTYVAQMPIRAAQMTVVLDKIEEKQSEIGSCTFTPPPLVPPIIP